MNEARLPVSHRPVRSHPSAILATRFSKPGMLSLREKRRTLEDAS